MKKLWAQVEEEFREQLARDASARKLLKKMKHMARKAGADYVRLGTMLHVGSMPGVPHVVRYDFLDQRLSVPALGLNVPCPFKQVETVLNTLSKSLE